MENNILKTKDITNNFVNDFFDKSDKYHYTQSKKLNIRLFDFLKDCGLEDDNNLRVGFDVCKHPYKNQLIKYFINNKMIYISMSLVTLLHEIGHFAESTNIQCEEVDFGLLIKNINATMMKREFVASGYEYSIKSSLHTSPISVDEFLDRIRIKLQVFEDIYNKYPHHHISFLPNTKIDFHEMKEIAIESFQTPVNIIKDRIINNVNYLKANNLIN